MAKVLRWFTRGVFGFHGAAHAARDADYACFERIDGASLGIDDFRLSASLRADDPLLDFAETLPACNYGHESARSMAVSRRAA
jgi:hypothetical protein